MPNKIVGTNATRGFPRLSRVCAQVAPTLPLMSPKTHALSVAVSTKGAYIKTTRVVMYVPPAKSATWEQAIAIIGHNWSIPLPPVDIEY